MILWNKGSATKMKRKTRNLWFGHRIMQMYSIAKLHFQIFWSHHLFLKDGFETGQQS